MCEGILIGKENKLTNGDISTFNFTDESGVVSTNENLSSVSGPIVLQRRGSVYGANVPMITGNFFKNFIGN